MILETGESYEDMKNRWFDLNILIFSTFRQSGLVGKISLPLCQQF